MMSSSSSSSSEDECDTMPVLAALESGSVSSLCTEERQPRELDLATPLPAAAELASRVAMPAMFVPPGKENNIVAAPAEPMHSRVAVCQGKACLKRGSAQLLEAAQQEAAAYGDAVQVVSCKCLDKCKAGPNVAARPPTGKRVTLTGVRPDMLPSIIKRSAADSQLAEQMQH